LKEEIKTMQRYLLFGFNTYYPAGGWNDFIGTFSNIDSAVKTAGAIGYEHYHVVDTETGEIVTDSD